MSPANVAAVDIGTNSVRLLITDAAGRELAREMQITRLGQGVDVNATLQPEAIARTVTVLDQFRALLQQHSVSRVRAAATSAARDASNREQFFDEAQAKLGTRPELLSGDEEAALSFRGATHGVDRALAPFLVIDIGGGSTELVLGSEQPEAMTSVAMGCVRMTERHLQHDPPTADELAACEADVRGILETVARSVPVAKARTVIGLAGTITSLASLQLGRLHYDPAATHHSRLSAVEVTRLCAQLVSVPVATRRTLLAEPKRAEVIVGGAVVLRTLMQVFSLSELLVSETDILDGLAASLRD